MADRPELALKNQLLANNDNDSVGTKLQRESELLRDGLSNGVVNRITEMAQNPGDTAVNVAICAGLGAGLNVASRAGGRWATGAKVATYGFGALMGVDIVRRAVPTIGAMGDAWSSNANMQANKDTVAKFAGSALVDYPVMMAAGYGGFRAGGKVPVSGPAQFSFNELPQLRNITLDRMPPATRALLDSGTPINTAARTALQNPKVAELNLADHAAAIKAMINPNGRPSNASALLEAGTPINAATRAAMQNPKIAELQLANRAEAMQAMRNSSGNPTYEMPAGFSRTAIARDLTILSNRTFSVSKTFVPAIIPVDVLQNGQGEVLRAGKMAGEIGENAAAAAAAGAAIPLRQQLEAIKPVQPKAEQPALIHELNHVLPRIEFKPLPQAFFQHHEILHELKNTTDKRNDK